MFKCYRLLRIQITFISKKKKKCMMQNAPMYCLTCNITDFTNPKLLLKVNILFCWDQQPVLKWIDVGGKNIVAQLVYIN